MSLTESVKIDFVDPCAAATAHEVVETDVREIGKTSMRETAGMDAIWRTGTPEGYGTYVAYVQVADGKKMLRELLWDGEEWFLFGSRIADDVTVCCWTDRPEVE